MVGRDVRHSYWADLEYRIIDLQPLNPPARGLCVVK